MRHVLGISCFYHDSAAALLADGEILAAAQEERFTRIKHDASFPSNAIRFVLDFAQIELAEVEKIVFYDKPLLKFERLLETYVAVAPRGFQSFRLAMPIWLREKLFLKRLLLRKLRALGPLGSPEKLLFSEHHFSHAASAFYPSPFERAVVLTLDGVGEWATTTVAIGEGNDLEIVKEIHFPHSLGLLYSAFTYYAGFRVNSGEYKLMGLAPYGQPIYRDLIMEKLVNVKDDGSFRLDQNYFQYTHGLKMIGPRFAGLFGQPARKPESDDLTQFHMDIASSIQAVIEEIILKITRQLSAEYRIPNLAMAGGVALNCVANGKILKDGAFERLWIQPASGDAGGALGAALGAWHVELGNRRNIIEPDAMRGAYLGPAFDNTAVKSALSALGAVFVELTEREILFAAVEALDSGRSVGWFQGRSEFGPRALGARSILADARSESMQKRLNLKIKFRESFRPFAPSVPREHVNEWFELDDDSPYMLLVADVRSERRYELSDGQKELTGLAKLEVKRSQIPAVTHVDNSARIQTVHRETHPRYHALLEKFHERTGCPVVVNTSFNVRGEPIVCTPEDAFRCFMGTDMDVLLIENCILYKKHQDPKLREDYRPQFEPD
jgi:carbamoyltransferase